MAERPFDTIESAREYVTLLLQEVRDVEAEIRADIEQGGDQGQSRRVDALRLAHYKLTQLANHLSSSSRLLNDLRVLRRLLLGEREDAPGEDVRKAPAPATTAGKTRLS
jgi:hypothetical protein